MQPHQISLTIDRARRAYIRRKGHDAPAPIIRDCDIILNRNGREVVVLREGDKLLAEFIIKANGELRYIENGKYHS